MSLIQNQAERTGITMDPRAVIGREEKRSAIMLSARTGGKSWRARILADAALARGESVGEIYWDAAKGRHNIRPYEPTKQKAKGG